MSVFSGFPVTKFIVIYISIPFVLKRGMIRSLEESYFVEPLPEHLHAESVTKGPSTPHILYRRSLNSHSRARRHTEEHGPSFCGVRGK